MDDRPEAFVAFLHALPQPALLVCAGQVRAANAAADRLLGGDDGVRAVESALAAGLTRLELHTADGVEVELELSLGPAPGVGGARVALLRDVAPEVAVRVRLERAIEFERLLTRGSALLMRSGEGALDSVIESILGDVGRFCGVDRAYVFRFDEAAGTQSNSHEWVAPGISREAANVQDAPLNAFPWLLAQLRADVVVRHASLDTLPPDAQAERAEFERQCIQSILIVPLWSAERLRGFIGFDAVNARIDWEDASIVGLRLLSQMLAGALDARAMSAMLHHQATHDALTGLPNRLYLAARFGAGGALPGRCRVAVVDVDDFKRVNDRHGHAGGDALLRELGRRLQAAVAPQAVVARLGGDEFVVIEPADAGSDDCLATRLIAAAGAPFAVPGGACRAGISVGLARGDGVATLDAVLDVADAAMYRAKAAGKNRWAACPQGMTAAEAG